MTNGLWLIHETHDLPVTYYFKYYDIKVISDKDFDSFINRDAIPKNNILFSQQAFDTNILFEKLLHSSCNARDFLPYLVTSTMTSCTSIKIMTLMSSFTKSILTSFMIT